MIEGAPDHIVQVVHPKAFPWHQRDHGKQYQQDPADVNDGVLDAERTVGSKPNVAAPRGAEGREVDEQEEGEEDDVPAALDPDGDALAELNLDRGNDGSGLGELLRPINLEVDIGVVVFRTEAAANFDRAALHLLHVSLGELHVEGMVENDAPPRVIQEEVSLVARELLAENRELEVVCNILLQCKEVLVEVVGRQVLEVQPPAVDQRHEDVDELHVDERNHSPLPEVPRRKDLRRLLIQREEEGKVADEVDIVVEAVGGVADDDLYGAAVDRPRVKLGHARGEASGGGVVVANVVVLLLEIGHVCVAVRAFRTVFAVLLELENGHCQAQTVRHVGAKAVLEVLHVLGAL
mmetsp:Transcript_19675/g.75483  ORF Transcript_19675/g.75483 Transcript_19675/m.75483 type:complete len:350 (+) Transcript_19675:728-1777(+)